MAGFLLAADLDFTYGFDVTVSLPSPRTQLIANNSHQVPNNSSVTLNIGQLNHSTQTGLFVTLSLPPSPPSPLPNLPPLTSPQRQHNHHRPPRSKPVFPP